MKLDKVEYLQAFASFFWRQWRTYALLVWVYAILFLVISLISDNAIVLSFAFVTVFAVLLFIFRRIQYAKAISEKPFLFEDIQWHYSSLQIGRVGQTFSDSIELNGIKSWQQNRKYIYLEKNKYGYYLIPKKAFQEAVLVEIMKDLRTRQRE